MDGLYEEAKRNVLRQIKAIEKQKLAAAIRDEMGALKYQSEIRSVTPEIWTEIESLKKTMAGKPVRGVWDGYAQWGFNNMLKDIEKSKRYHPDALELMRSHARRP